MKKHWTQTAAGKKILAERSRKVIERNGKHKSVDDALKAVAQKVNSRGYRAQLLVYQDGLTVDKFAFKTWDELVDRLIRFEGQKIAQILVVEDV